MKKVIEVKEQGSDTCPYCGYVHEPTEGYSEMHLDGRCEIICAKCGEMYFYNSNLDVPHVDDNGTLHMPHSAFAKSISSYNSGGGCMIDEIELDTGELLVISDDAIGIYDNRAAWEEGDGYMETMDRREARLTSRCTRCNHIYRKDHDAKTVCPKCTHHDKLTWSDRFNDYGSGSPVDDHTIRNMIKAAKENKPEYDENGNRKDRPFKAIDSMRGRW